MPKTAAPNQATSAEVPIGLVVVLVFVLAVAGGAAAAITREQVSPAAAITTALAVMMCAALAAGGYWFGRTPMWWTTRVWFWSLQPDRIILGIATAVGACITAAHAYLAATATEPLWWLYSHPWWAIADLATAGSLGGWLFIAGRLRLRRLARMRLLHDETLTTRVVAAIRRASAVEATAHAGVTLDPTTNRPTAGAAALTAPHPVGARQAFGVINHDRLITPDQYRTLNDWTDPTNRWMLAPTKSGAMRALLIAVSGAGKTVLEHDWALCAAAQKWSTLFLDLKGVHEDSEKLVASIKARTGSDAQLATGGFHFYDATPAQLRERILALFPAATGDGAWYASRRTAILRFVIADELKAPITCLADLEKLFATPDLLADPARARRALHNPTKTGGTDGGDVLLEVTNAIFSLGAHITDTTNKNGWSFRSISETGGVWALPLSPGSSEADRTAAAMLLVALRHHLHARVTAKDYTPFVCIVDEFPQMVGADDDAAVTATQLFEVARSTNMGLVMSAQTVSGLSNDPNMQQRLLNAGQAVIFGRTTDPEPLIVLAGTTMQLESSADPEGGLKSARAQHTYRINPADVRDAELGAFWIIADTTTRRFNALP